ncbi:protein phosphatase 1 regulatory subunit 7, partial [Paragonimus westermani]
GNRITKIAGLDRLVNLEQLYLSENGITQIEGLENLHKLQILDLARNFISRIENISHLNELEEFWFNDNKVASWDQVEHLTVLKKLQTLYMERNPIYFANTERTRMDPNYRRKIMLTLPGLRQLDANLTGVGLNCTDSTELQLGV